ncbi:MAG: zonular occludens toxin domain-containing protein [Acidiferrobacterales bacterium]|nr:zonular occludens toxin domain-containing protein [Acidiferrobacterales bacterium]
MYAVFTGTPGAGKTINLIQYVCEDKQFEGRQVFYYGINECKIDNCTELTKEQFETWYEFIPDNSVLIVDECQEHWRAGIPTKDLPLHLTKLERHRHRGIDIVATCQSMHQLHRMAKVLVDQHRHYSRPHGKESWQCLTYTEAKDNPASQTHAKHAIKTSGKFNKDYFDKYVSATSHNYRNRFPKKYIYMAAAVALSIPVTLTFAHMYIKGFTKKEVEDFQPSVEKSESRSFQNTWSRLQTTDDDRSEVPRTVEELVAMLTPMIDNRPDTAPIYLKGFSEAKDYPREQCVMFNSGDKKGACRCYSQQGTRMRVDESTCRNIIFEGREFDHRIAPRSAETRFSGEDVRTSQENAIQARPQRVRVVRNSGRPDYPTAANSFGGIR